MKKYLIILIITNVYQFVYAQKIPFKIIDGDIEWQETYEEDLKIKPQTIYFTEPKKKGGQYINKCFKADLFVYKKNGITSLKVRNFMFLIGSIPWISIDIILPDIIILDWMMPFLSGVEVCRKLRSQASTRQIPIIMLSARGEEGDRTLGLDIGADDYITKPFSPKELISRIKAILRRTRPSTVSEVLEHGNLKLYPGKRLVERDGIKINLGPKEFNILSTLMERPGQVFSRAQLLDNAWGHGVFVEDRTVDVHIGRLRKALSRHSIDKSWGNVIRTVRSSGYALALSENNVVS